MPGKSRTASLLRQRSEIRLVMVCVGAAVSLSACCSDSDKKSFLDAVDRAIERNFRACDGFVDEARKLTCNTPAQNQQSALFTAYAGYITACATGNSDLIKEAMRNLKDLLEVPFKAVVSSDGRVVNSDMVLCKEDGVRFSILLTADGSKAPQDFVDVNRATNSGKAAGTFAAEAVGIARSLSTQTATSDRAASISTTFEVAPGSSVSLAIGGLTVSGSVSGSVSLASAGGNVPSGYVPIDAKLTIRFAGKRYTMTLDKQCKYNAMAVDSNGRGTLGFRVILAEAGDSALFARLPSAAWIVLPIQRNMTGTQIQVSSGGVSLGGWQVCPVEPNPIADFNKNSVVDHTDFADFITAFVSDNARADLNYDGVLTPADYDMFLDRWNYWSQP